MIKKINFKKNVKTYLNYTILFIILIIIVFAIFIKMNKGFIWQSDGFKQHFVILYNFNQIMRNIFQNGFQMLSWNMGLGLDVIGQYSYYILGDPFAYISLLFPIEQLETAYNSLIILRIYCVGLAFIAYCKYHKKSRTNTLIGGIIYAFCGFILYAGIRHPYFTNAAIFLPLTFLGIDKLLKENKKTYLTLIVFISAISNYYFFYMIVIIDIIYAIIKYIVEYNNGIKEFFKKFFQAVFCYVVGIMMASIVLLPSVYAFLNSSRTEYEQSYVYGSKFYEYLFMGIISFRFKNWAVIGVSSIVILMIPILLTKFKKKEEKTYTFLWIITTIMLLIPFIASLMNGLSFPSNRWIFAYSFILSYIVTLCFENKYTKKQIILMSITLGLYGIIGIILTKLQIKKNLDFYGAIGIAVFILILFWWNYYRTNMKSKRIFKYTNLVIMLLVIINIGGISFALYSSIGKGYATEFLDNGTIENKYATLNGKIENFKEGIEYIKQNDTSFYRISKNDSNNQNVSLLYDYNPIQTFLSIGNGYVYNLSCNLEDNCYKATQCINGMDRRTKITTLLATKYFICNKKDSACVPYGYELFHEIGNTQIYINKNYVSLGVVYDNYILYEEYNNLTPLQKEDILLNTAIVEEEINNVSKGRIDKIEGIQNLNYIIDSKIVKDNKIKTEEENESISLIINGIEENTELYLSINNLKYNDGKEEFKVTTNFNGVKGKEELLNYNTSAYYMENRDFLINLGIAQKDSNNKLKITFNNKGTYSWDNMEILAVSMEKYEKKIQELKQNEMTNVQYGNNYIEGNVDIKTNGILQISTSYSEGWKVFVDGKQSKIIKVNEGFIGTLIETGEHKVRFEYETPYLKMGAILSLIGFIIFKICIYLEKKSKLIRVNN